MLYWSYKYICVWFSVKMNWYKKIIIKWGNIGTLPWAGRCPNPLPSAGRWQGALQSAGRWQRGHVSSTCKIWAGLFGPFAICQPMAKSFAICWQTAKYAVSLLTGLTPLRGFAICQLMAKAQALCHQPTVGKEAFTGRVSDELFAICWQMAMPLPSADHAFAICHGRWQRARFQ